MILGCVQIYVVPATAATRPSSPSTDRSAAVPDWTVQAPPVSAVPQPPAATVRVNVSTTPMSHEILLYRRLVGVHESQSVQLSITALSDCDCSLKLTPVTAGGFTANINTASAVGSTVAGTALTPVDSGTWSQRSASEVPLTGQP